MKIEKISDNQIRCTLNKQDLQERELRISELAYGTEKAKELFRDMMQQASYEFGFEAEDIPLMIEAIPVSAECLVLVVTKVEDPDELDTRFSSFSSDRDSEEDLDLEEDEHFEEELFSTLLQDEENVYEATLFEDSSAEKEFIPLPDAVAPANIIKSNKKSENVDSAPMPVFRIFSFSQLDDVIDLSKKIGTFYHGANSLFKDTEEEIYYLIMSKDDHTVEEFNKISNVVTEFGTLIRSNYATLSYFQEHFLLIQKGHTVQAFCNL